MTMRLLLIHLIISIYTCFCSSISNNIILTWDQVINMIFDTFDADHDDYLDQYECFELQHATNPSLPLNWRDYQAICKMTDAIYALGLTRQQFSMTYNELSHILGSNLHNDLNILYNKGIITNYKIYNYYRMQ